MKFASPPLDVPVLFTPLHAEVISRIAIQSRYGGRNGGIRRTRYERAGRCRGSTAITGVQTIVKCDCGARTVTGYRSVKRRTEWCQSSGCIGSHSRYSGSVVHHDLNIVNANCLCATIGTCLDCRKCCSKIDVIYIRCRPRITPQVCGAAMRLGEIRGGISCNRRTICRTDCAGLDQAHCSICTSSIIGTRGLPSDVDSNAVNCCARGNDKTIVRTFQIIRGCTVNRRCRITAIARSRPRCIRPGYRAYAYHACARSGTCSHRNGHRRTAHSEQRSSKQTPHPGSARQTAANPRH